MEQQHLTNVIFSIRMMAHTSTRKCLIHTPSLTDPMLNSKEVVDTLDNAGAKGTFFFSELCTKPTLRT